METIKQLEKNIKELGRNWKIPRDDKYFTKRNMNWFESKAKLDILKGVLKLIDDLDDEHLVHFRNKKSQEYIGGWIDALEELKQKIKTEPNKVGG